MVARILFPWLTSWRNTIASPAAGDHKGNKCRTPPLLTALAPTDRPASCLTSRLRLTPVGDPLWSPLSPETCRLRREHVTSLSSPQRVIVH